MDIKFAGIDGEMTGSNCEKHSLIQIGIAFSNDITFSSYIGWSNFEYNPESLEVIGIDPEDIKTFPIAAEVDDNICKWLDGMGIEEHTIIPVGWEVAAFDRPFIKKALPRFYKYLHHHSVELNSIMYTFGDVMPYLGERPNSHIWKKMAKFAGTFNIKVNEGRWPKVHNAEDDALMSWHSWNWARNIICDGNPGKLYVEPINSNLDNIITSVDATRG